jgi:phage gpG-like protein
MQDLINKINRLNKFLSDGSVQRIVGTEAVKHYKQSFRDEAFSNNAEKDEPWEDVKRRDKDSKWYGFNYTGEKRTSVRIARNRDGTTRRAKRQKRLNFSRAATIRKILSGPSKELYNSIRFTYGRNVVIRSDKPYARVQNDGGNIKVFGKGSAKLPARKFVGRSRVLINRLNKNVTGRINKIMQP